MTEPTTALQQRHDRRMARLARVAEVAGAALEKLAGKLEETEDTDELCKLSSAINGSARTISRVSMLEAKFEHDIIRLRREAEGEYDFSARSIRARRVELKAALGRIRWPDGERMEILEALDGLSDWEFVDANMDELIVKLCQSAGVEVPDSSTPQAPEGASAPKPATEPAAVAPLRLVAPPPSAAPQGEKGPVEPERSAIWRRQMAQIERERAQREAEARDQDGRDTS